MADETGLPVGIKSAVGDLTFWHELVEAMRSGERGVDFITIDVDLVNVAREAMLALGRIQAQECHTDRCPTGVATQDPWLAHGLDPTLRSVRVANYVRTLRRDLLEVAEAVGVAHPA